MEKKVTKKDIYAEIVTLAREAGREDIVEFATLEIGRLEAKAEKAKERRAAKAAEADVLKDAVAGVLNDELQTSEEITEQVMNAAEEVTKAKVIARLTKLVKEGFAGKVQVKVDGKRVMAYALADAIPADDEE